MGVVPLLSTLKQHIDTKHHQAIIMEMQQRFGQFNHNKQFSSYSQSYSFNDKDDNEKEEAKNVMLSLWTMGEDEEGKCKEETDLSSSSQQNRNNSESVFDLEL